MDTLIPIVRMFSSKFGLALACIYFLLAGWVTWVELHETGGGWINLRGMLSAIVTAPSQATLGTLLKSLGVKPVNFSDPGLGGYAQIVLHLLMTAFVIYLLGYGLEWGFRRLATGLRG